MTGIKFHKIAENEWHVNLGSGGEGEIRFDVYKGTDIAIANISYGTAHALADWIIENVPKPAPEPPQTLKDWAEMPVGAEFGFGKKSSRHPCIKTGGWTYGNRSGTRQRDIRTGSSSDLSNGLAWRLNPLPTGTGAVVRSGDAVYVLADAENEPKWVTPNKGGCSYWITGADLREDGFEVLFAGVSTEAKADKGVKSD